MNILFIGLDRSLCDLRPGHGTLTKNREKRLARFFKRYAVLILTPRQPFLSPEWTAGPLSVSATLSAGPAGMVADAVHMGLAIHRRDRIDLITTQDPLLAGLAGYLLKKRLGVPLHIQIHGDYLDNVSWLRESRLHAWYNRLGHYLLARADGVTTVHPGLKEKIQAYRNPSASPVTALQHGLGIHSNHFYPACRPVFRSIWSGQAHRHVVLFAGRLTQQKNLPALLAAVKTVVPRYPQTRFVLAGTGEQKPFLLKRTQELHLDDNVIWPGRLSETQMPAAYQSSDVFVLPSFYEGHARVLMEAAVSGLPIVTTDTGGARDVVQDRFNGLLLNRLDPESLANGLMTILSQMEKYRSAAQARRHEFKTKFDQGPCLADLARQIRSAARPSPSYDLSPATLA